MRSAGILVFRRVDGEIEVLIAHMGGPFWARKDAWSIPKGEVEVGEPEEAAARREFREELGLSAPGGSLVALGESKQSGGKVVVVWAVESDLDLSGVEFGTFEMEWPRGSGRVQSFPEVDRVEWFGVAAAREKLVRGQRVFLDRLLSLVQA